MGDICVFPGVTFEGEMNTFTLKLVKMDSETQEAFAQRCQKIADFALSFVPKDTALRVDLNDPRFKHKQVGPTSWEIETPGYEPEKE